MGNDVEFNIIARDRASSTFSKVGRSANETSKNVSGLGSSAKKAFSAFAAFESVKFVTKGLIGMAKAAAEDQVSTALLARQLEKSAHATKGQVAATEAYITKLGQTKGVADDLARNSIGTLVTATHSVTKAQHLNNLAMDIAAAKGKPLAAVSLALAKAYNGSIGGLGRLGIKTKDATGKTLTFAAAQRDLEKQFGGAAAAKAQTFTGVLDRFHVAVNEAGESIGYKLLPQLTKFLPKVSAFITGMQNGTGAGGKFAATIKDQVLPVAKNLAAEAQLVVGALKPLFEFMAKLPPQVLATGGAIGFLAPRIGSLRAPLEEGASGFSKLGRAAASAAGAAGMLAVADAANRTSPAIGGLEGALGGAAAGFAATGSPIGALIGGVGGGLLGIFSAGKKAATGIDATGEAARRNAASVDAFRATVDQTTGAFTRLTNVEAARQLQNAGAFKDAAKLNLTPAQVTRASLGKGKDADAVQKAITRTIALNAQLEDLAKHNKVEEFLALNKKLGLNTVAQSEAFEAAGKAAKHLQDQLGPIGNNAKAASKGALELSLAAGDLSGTLGNLPSSKVIKIIQEGGKQAKADIVALAAAQNLTRPQIRVLLSVANLPHTLNDIKAIRTAADNAAKPRTISFGAKIAQGAVAGIVSMVNQAVNSATNNGPGRRRAGTAAGNAYVDQFVKAVSKGTPKVKVALDRATNLLGQLKDKLSSLQDIKKGFLGTFQADNLFGTDLSGGGGIGALFAAAQKGAAQAGQLQQDVQTVKSLGISKSLLTQLQSQGTAGADQLHALAGGSAAQIAAFNNLDKATTSALQSAGLIVGNQVRGGDINADIRGAQQALVIEQAMTRALLKAGLKGEVKVKGGDLIVAVRTTNHGRGRQAGDFTS